MARIFQTVREVVDALGGVPAVAREFGVVEGAVRNWIADDALPAKTYVGLHELLAAIPAAAPDRLWKMAPRVHQSEVAA